MKECRSQYTICQLFVVVEINEEAMSDHKFVTVTMRRLEKYQYPNV